LKKWDMNSENIESMIKSITGTAKNMGIEVEK
jgi:ribosomal protein L11